MPVYSLSFRPRYSVEIFEEWLLLKLLHTAWMCYSDECGVVLQLSHLFMTPSTSEIELARRHGPEGLEHIRRQEALIRQLETGAFNRHGSGASENAT
jgi:hypothetical protein